MATKLDTEKKLFLGPTAVREGTVVDAMRQSVRDLDQGEGVSYADLEAHMLANFAPKKSQGYGASYVKAYVRDGVNKYGHLSYEDGGHSYSAVAAPEKKAAAPKAKKLTKAQQAEVDTLNFIRTRGEVADAGDIDSSQITIADLVTETGKKTKTVTTQVEKLEKDGLVRSETREGNEGEQDSIYVYLTQAGFAKLQELDSQPTGEPTAATGTDGGEV
jgi:DNA-binding MarR family transcriptional regulator